jgi:hypothetical protein
MTSPKGWVVELAGAAFSGKLSANIVGAESSDMVFVGSAF